MQKNCDLELRLFPLTSSSSSYDSESDISVVKESTSSGKSQQKEESQRITIFYNGKLFITSEVTHLQAKSIISMANREMEARLTSNGSTRLHHHHQQLPNPKASMRKSLQTFLQKRKNRIQAASPYHHHSRR